MPVGLRVPSAFTQMVREKAFTQMVRESLDGDAGAVGRVGVEDFEQRPDPFRYRPGSDLRHL